MCRLIVAVFLLYGLLYGSVFAVAQEPVEALHDGHDSEERYEHGRNHLSLFLGGTNIEFEEDGFTAGLDYEYRVSELLGLGGVVEYAAGNIDAWSFLAVADIHIYKGFIAQIGPGIETSSEDTIAITRAGILYEFERQGFTISPQLHYDVHFGAGDGIVFGIAIGRSF